MSSESKRLGAAAVTVALIVTTTALSGAESKSIPLDQLGAMATKQVEGNGLSITATENGAHLRCAFQRLEGQATAEGLWLTSTAEGANRERFRLVAASVGRVNSQPSTLPATGKVSIADQLVRFIRPGLIEEYSVSVDGVRQDFVIAERLEGEGELRVELAVGGAKVEPSALGSGSATGAKLTLKGSGRTLAYSRLRATDATGRELKAHMEVLTSNSESRKQKAETSQSRLTSAATNAGLAVLVDDTDATYPVRIDPTFSDADWVSLNPGVQGTDGTVNAMAVDASGHVYVGGAFSVAGTVAANNIAKWDGGQWSALGLGTDGAVRALAIIGTDLYAGGSFHTAGGMTVNHIAKWDGTQWSALGSGTSSEVEALAVIGTDLYAGGEFSAAGEVAAIRIARWDGTSWSALGSGMGGSYPSVYTLAVIGTDLYAGGFFGTAGGVPANNIAKWNGSTWSALGPGLSPSINALAVIGTDLYAGGPNTIARWNGSQWASLASGIGGAGVVGTLAVSGTDLYVGGWFSSVSGVPANNLAKWNGGSWSALRGGTDDGVQALAISGSDLYVGGKFSGVDGSVVRNIAQWNGTQWSALGSSLPNCDWIEFGALAANQNDVYAAVRHADPIPPGNSGIATIEKRDGDEWLRVGSVVRAPGSAYVYAMILDGTDLYIGGIFTSVNGTPANNIARWDGSAWSALGSGVAGYEVRALAASGSDLYVGGSFTTAGGVTVNNIAKWDGSQWSALGSGMDRRVGALAVSGTDLYAGGWFDTAGGVPASNIARWNGSTWWALGLGANSEITALAMIGTDLYVGGVFTTAGGVTANHIAKWDGSQWSALGSGVDGDVYALAAIGTDLYAGGSFTTAGGVTANHIAKWDGSSWFALGSGVSDNVEGLAIDGKGHLFVGGGFSVAGGKVSPFIARANITGLAFNWDGISSPEEVGVSFPVTLTARNAAGEVLTNFTDTVNLSSYVPGLTTTNFALGTGTNAWGYPLYSRFHDARTQVIYLANELGQACTINSLALEVTTPPGQTLENWTIRMKHTTLAKYPTSPYVAPPEWEGSDWTVVYQGDEPAGTAGWRTFTFSTPFDYNGTDNLLVDFSFNNAYYSSEGQCRYTVTYPYRSITYATDSAYGDPLTWSGTSPTPVLSYNVPNVALGATYPDVLPVSLSPTVTTAFVDGVWTGEVTVLEAVSNLVLRADDGLGHGGESNPFDVQGVAQPPVIVTDDGQLGFANGSFGFNLQGQAGQMVVFEVSTNLVDWLPLQTNTLSGDPFYFSDPDTANFIQRFYRAVIP